MKNPNEGEEEEWTRTGKVCCFLFYYSTTRKTQKNFSYLFFLLSLERENPFFSLCLLPFFRQVYTHQHPLPWPTILPFHFVCFNNPKMFRPRKMGLLIGRSRSNRPVRYTQGDRQQKTKRDIDRHTHTHTHCVYIVAYTYFVYLFKLRVMIVSYLWAGNFACPIFLI
jgi:hypothetical protein